MLGIGIDTGGTCTDAVIYDMDRKEIVGKGKALTTKSNLEIGISKALDKLPENLLKKAEVLALSTTLATNACVENKGARTKLLMFGFEESMMDRLKHVYESYGFHNRDDFVLMDAKAENLFPDAFDPDWETLRANAKEWFADCDSIGIVQKHPRANGGRFELIAREILREELNIPITISQDISKDVDILKTCAGTMLNARLIPLIAEFMDAVHKVLDMRNLRIPIHIVRSDGTLMSEEMAKSFPVETLLCGPAASVIGGAELSDEKNAVIVDMGGTTTDIAIIQNNFPVMEEKGIHIGQWKTMVKGLFVDTFGLGGDSAVRFAKGEIYLDTQRVIPISALASQYDFVVPKLRELMSDFKLHGKWIYEFYVLQKKISDKSGYTKEEQLICKLLEDGPLIAKDLSKFLNRDPHYIHTERLEQAGVIIKSGLTPTDMMILKGDFKLYSKEAAQAALEYMVLNTKKNAEEVPDLVYELVEKRMYKNLGRILLSRQFPKNKALFEGEAGDVYLECCYKQAKEKMKNSSVTFDAHLMLTTNKTLIGVGAPIHIFLPKVAKLLQTKVVIPQFSSVTNACGAISCQTVAYEELRIKADYIGLNFMGYSVFEKGRKYLFQDYQEADKFAREVLIRIINDKARLQGIHDPFVEIETKKVTASALGTGIFLETQLYASAKQKNHK